MASWHYQEATLFLKMWAEDWQLAIIFSKLQEKTVTHFMTLFSVYALLKTEIQEFFDVFRGYTKRRVAADGLICWMLCSVCPTLTLMACWSFSGQIWASHCMVGFKKSCGILIGHILGARGLILVYSKLRQKILKSNNKPKTLRP